MRSIIRYFIKYPVMGNGLIVAFALFGIVALQNTTTNFFPTIPNREIQVVAVWPGASPQEVEEGIVSIVEDKLKGISGVKEIVSVSTENSAIITLEVSASAKPAKVLIDVENEIDKITTLPNDVESFSTYIVDRLDQAIDIVLSGDVDLIEVKRAAKEFERDLLDQEGISKVTLVGFPDEEIEIALTEAKMTSYQITFDEVMRAVQSSNLRVTGGTIKGEREEMLIRANAKGYYPEELGAIVLKKTENGGVVYLRDVANVIGKWEDTPERIRFNGTPAVLVQVQTSKSEDLIKAAVKAKSLLKEFNEKNTSIHAEVLLDRSEIIKERIKILQSNGVQGILLVMLFLGVFLHFRMAFWVSMVIPVSLLGVFMVGPLYGFTINVMSLLGLILVLGMLVDHGIVIAENIYSRFEEGMSALDAAVEGTMEVISSVIGSVLTTMVIFLSFFFLEGPLGDRAKDLGFVVIAALGFSLIEAMFILPAHIAHSKALVRHDKNRPRAKNIVAREFTRAMDFMDSALQWFRLTVYARGLKYCLKNPHISIATAVAILIITIGATRNGVIKTTLFPNIEMNFIQISLSLPAGSVESITDSLLVELEKDVWAVNDSLKKEMEGKSTVLGVVRSITTSSEGSLFITLIQGAERDFTTKEFGSMVRKHADPMPQAEKVTFGGQTFFGYPVSVSMRGGDFADLQRAKKELRTIFMGYPELKDVIDSDPQGVQEVQLTLKPHAYALGLTTQMVMSQVRQGFFGGRAQRIQRGSDEVEINIRYDITSRTSLDELRDMRIRTSTGASFPLGEIADFSVARGVMKIGHRDGLSEILVESNLEDPNSVSAVNARIQEEVIPVMQQKYPSIAFSMEGESKASKETTDSAKVVVPIMLFLMYLVVVYTFRSFLQAIVVFMLIPFSLTGAFWGHWITSQLTPNTYAVSMLSVFGLIALMGIIVNDSLVLIEAMNRNLKDGKSFDEALYDAGVSRFRPVVLTSITTIGGLGPLIFSSSFHAQFLAPMAISVGYGLLFATLLNLLLLPSFLMVTNKVRRFMHWVWYAEHIDPREVEPAIIEEREVTLAK